MLSYQSSSDDIIVARNAFRYRESMLGVAIGLAIPLWRTGAPIRCSFRTFFDGFARVALSWFQKKNWPAVAIISVNPIETCTRHKSYTDWIRP